MLPNYVVAADLEAGGLAREALVLGLSPQTGEGENAGTGPDPGASRHDSVSGDLDAARQLHLRADDRVRPDDDVVCEARAVVDDRARVDLGHGGISPSC